jgi:TfoX/Sxy family transcriptional regulator of competence genes
MFFLYLPNLLQKNFTMAYDELLSDRIKQVLKDKNVPFSEKKMFGGLSLMVDEKMCVGIIKNNLMVRIDPEFHEKAISMNACREMDFTKRPMKGFVYVEPEGIDLDDDLEFWIDKALEYNPKAKSSKKK